MATHNKFVLYSRNPHPNAAKVQIAAKFGGVEIEFAPGFEFGITNKTPEYLKKNPAGQIPVLDTPDGAIFESNAITYYVARVGTDAAGLLGATPYANAQVDQWANFARSRLEGLGDLFMFAIGRGEFNQQKFDEAKKKVGDAFAVLNTHFEHHPNNKFLIGDRITVADIIVGQSVYVGVRVSLDEEFLNHYPKVKQYLTHYFTDPHVAAVIGDFKFVPIWKI